MFYDYQQSGVVAMHTDLKVGKYYGEMGVDFWDDATWKQELDKYEVCFIYNFSVYVLLLGNVNLTCCCYVVNSFLAYWFQLMNF